MKGFGKAAPITRRTGGGPCRARCIHQAGISIESTTQKDPSGIRVSPSLERSARPSQQIYAAGKLQPNTRMPEVVRTPRSGGKPEASASPSGPRGIKEPNRATPLRKSTSEEIRDVWAEETSGRSSEADLADVRGAEVATGMRVIEYQPEIGGRPVQLDATSPKTYDQTGQRLLENVERAVKKFEEVGLTDEQISSLRLLEESKRHTLYDAYRGARIDEFTKQAVMDDPELQHVYVTVLKERGPDFFDSRTGAWYDMTTTKAWKEHVTKYGAKNVSGFRLPTEVLR